MAIATAEQVQNLHDTVLQRLKDRFGESIFSSSMEYDFPCFLVKREKAYEILQFLKEDQSLNFHFLTTLCGLHYPEQAGHEMGVMYQLHNMPQNTRIRIKTFFPEKDAHIQSITSLWPTANWMERQEYDFFGIRFNGHPDLRRILNMDDFHGYPMRKEFPLEDPTRDDKNDSMFGR